VSLTETGGSDLRNAIAVLQSVLLNNLLPFWRRQSGDEHSFGYMLADYSAVKPGIELGPINAEAGIRGVVGQSRTLWFFAKLMSTPYRDPTDEFQARRGFKFLADKMWDQKNGGFYWQIDDRGRPLFDKKQLYGHAFALYGLSQYAASSGSIDAKKVAHATFDYLERRFHDPEHPGYREFFAADWTEVAPAERTFLGHSSAYKHYNSHLHVLEALIEYQHLENTELVRERIVEVCDILSSRVLRLPHFACSDVHFRDWRPVNHPELEPTSYGHDLENIHLLITARRALAEDNGKFLDLYRAVFDNAQRFGEDQINGGFFYTGLIGKPADDLRKVWWVQAEALVACAELFRLTSDPTFAECFMRVLKWVVERQIDWKGGEWFAEITPQDQVAGAKIDLWKEPYHTGRAVLQCLGILQELALGALSL
jgi:cellobiose epimerase